MFRHGWRFWFAYGLLLNITRADARPIVAGAARPRRSRSRAD
jgi:hypothetical protein